MPLIRFDIIKGRSKEEIGKMLDVAHDAVVEALQVPVSDRYQVVTSHEPEDLVIRDTGLGFIRDNKFTLITILSSEREERKKIKLYDLMAEKLSIECGITKENLMISIHENGPADWSFGMGEAQFINGKLNI